ncbi:uncharacterized protein LOC119740753 [Patiria miniata]|uniref:Uncharacterized protein n=1 Tax=Patiria miniata TaxID=46514 RepID=A0A914B7B9_PATMI|nr:uncharacterized protein LOC119740753 [Patiria miniata]
MGVLQVTKQMFKLMVLLFVSIQSLTVAIQENHTTVDDIKTQLGLQSTKAPASPEPKNCPVNGGLVAMAIIMSLLFGACAIGNVYQLYKRRQPKKTRRNKSVQI